MVPRLVEGRCLYCTLGGPGSIPVEAVRASNVFFHDLVLLMFIRQENCTNQPTLTHLPELWVYFLINIGHYYVSFVVFLLAFLGYFQFVFCVEGLIRHIE